MTSHADALASHIQTLNRVIGFYEKQVKRLNQLVGDQAELIRWMDDKHEGFYQSQAWLELRQRVLDTYGPTCMCCGVTKNDETIQVDHVKPKARYPALALVFENMQVLCQPCNLGKGTAETDYRKKAPDA